MPSPPVIGICAAMEPARWAVWELPAALAPMNYVEQVQRAGGVALLIPPDPALAERPDPVLDRIDGLLLIGGPDVEAARYGAEAHPLAEPPVPLRDAVEIALAKGAAARGIPVLGICRGMQVLNVAAGGTLRQHLPDELGHTEHRRTVGALDGNEHEVELEPGSRAAEAAGGPEARVVSHHHQGVERLGVGLRATGRAAGDGVVEAIEADGAAWLVGVQGHPEADPGSPVIAALVDAARGRRRAGTEEKGADSPIPAARRDANETDR